KSKVNVGNIKLFINKSHSTKFSAVIIECRSIKTFLKFAGLKTQFTWCGKKASLIKNPDPKMWDIIIVEKV
ncbi:MAG: hypothetical protein U9Q34_01715, partial [Elusimicrobiota bacterium]|nr:hypothetical protein [Elusimicrobiota bacterium]